MPRRKRNPVSALPIDVMADSFRLDLGARNRSDNTIDGYLLSVRLFVEFLKEHDRPLTIDVSRDDVRAFINDQTDRNSAATALVRFKGLQQFFKFCVGESELDVSPMAGMEAPSVKRDDPPIVDDDVLNAAPQGRARPSRSVTGVTPPCCVCSSTPAPAWPR